MTSLRITTTQGRGGVTASTGRTSPKAIHGLQQSRRKVTSYDSPYDVLALGALIPRLKSPHAINALIETSEFLPIPVNLENQDLARQRISLPGIDAEIVDSARTIADRFIRTNSQKRIRLNNFRDRIGQVSLQEETLAGFYCVGNEQGMLSGLPIGMANINSADYVSRARVILRHGLVDLRDDLKTARAVEEFQGWNEAFKLPGIPTNKDKLGVVESLQVAFPGLFYGFNPPVRMFLIKRLERNRVPGAREMKVFASAWLLGVKEKLFDLKERKFNDARVNDQGGKYLDVSSIGMDDFRGDEHISSPRDIYKLGSEGLGVANPFDEENPLTSRVTRIGMWTEVGVDNQREIDLVSEKLFAEVLPDKYRSAFADDGGIIPLEFMKIPFATEYHKEAPCCIGNSGVSVPEALMRVRPNFFGFGQGQVIPEDIPAEGRWSGPVGVTRFRRKLAAAFHRSGMSYSVDHFGGDPAIKILGRDFSGWFDTQKERNREAGKKWEAFFNEIGVMPAVNYLAGGSSIGFAFSSLLGCSEKVSLRGNKTGEAILRECALSLDSEIRIPIDFVPSSNNAIDYFSAKRNSPSLRDLYEIREYCRKYFELGRPKKEIEQDIFPRDFSAGQSISVPDTERSFVERSLLFHLYLYSMVRNRPVQEVYDEFREGFSGRLLPREISRLEEKAMPNNLSIGQNLLQVTSLGHYLTLLNDALLINGIDEVLDSSTLEAFFERGNVVSVLEREMLIEDGFLQRKALELLDTDFARSGGNIALRGLDLDFTTLVPVGVTQRIEELRARGDIR